LGIECVEKKYFDKLSWTIVFQQAGGAVNLQPELPRNYETLGNIKRKNNANLFDVDDMRELVRPIPIYNYQTNTDL
jgi:hypothetical protein